MSTPPTTMSSGSSEEDTANLDSVIAHACRRLGYPDIRPSQHTAMKSFLQGKIDFATDWRVDDDSEFCQINRLHLPTLLG